MLCFLPLDSVLAYVPILGWVDEEVIHALRAHDKGGGEGEPSRSQSGHSPGVHLQSVFFFAFDDRQNAINKNGIYLRKRQNTLHRQTSILVRKAREVLYRKYGVAGGGREVLEADPLSLEVDADDLQLQHVPH
jgi:hypothetical protein